MAEQKPQITMTPCKSAAITAHGYDAATKTLALQFKGGRTYRYGDVPQAIAAGIADAKSIGKYIGNNVTGKFKLLKD